MNINFLSKVLDYVIFALVVLLAFLLVFEQFIILSGIAAWAGHLHPALLHFPIVLIFITIIQYWRKDKYFSLYLSVTLVLTLATAVSGLLLSIDGAETKGDLVLKHQWAGVTLAFLMTAWYWYFRKGNKKLIGLFHVFLAVIVILTGHLGGMITHGQDFLMPPFMESKPLISEEECSKVYECYIRPVLNDKCVSCHNTNKSKGKLILSDFTGLMKGGENGPVINVDDLADSPLLRLINFPSDHEYHMPPKDEQQLSEDELDLLTAWVMSGATDSLSVSDVSKESEFFASLQNHAEKRKNGLWEELPKISDSEITALGSDYCTISRMYNQSNALRVLIYNGEDVDTRLKKLRPLSKNIVELDMKNLTLSDQAFQSIAAFHNLEFLNIGSAEINDESIRSLEKLDKLKVLKAYETNLTRASVQSLSSMQHLEELYIWQTDISEDDIKELLHKKPKIKIYTAPALVAEFRSKLPVPKIAPDKVFFSAPFYITPKKVPENIDVYFTVDGSEPDNRSAKFGDSLLVTSSIQLKFFGSKQGWESSSSDSVTFIKSAISPKEFSLTHPPDKKYTGKGIKLLFDLEKGSEEYSDSSWMAFRDDPMVLDCSFETDIRLTGIVLSSLVQTDRHLFPPASIKVFGGASEENLKLIGEMLPVPLTGRKQGVQEFYKVAVENTEIRCLQIVVRPQGTIPSWHNAKGERAWFFIDELVLSNESEIF